MPLPKLSELTPEQKELYGEAHEAWLRADAFEAAILELQEPEHPGHFRERWAKDVIPVLHAEQDKHEAEHWRILRELGHERR
jgi:hypothetical protein